MKISRFFLLISGILLALVIAGCSSKYTERLDFNPLEPLRVAVLPFAQVDPVKGVSNSEGRIILDNLSLVSTTVADTPAQILRKQSFSELQGSALDLLSVALIDIDLPHQGFALADGTIDLKKLYNTDPAELCSKFLNCDAILYGYIHRWDREYYGVQSVNTVDIELKLVLAKNSKVLFEARGKDTESRGLTKGPTGISDLVLEPIKGLDAEIINELGKSVVTRLLKPLRVSERPEFLSSEPPDIFAASHNAPDGKLLPREPLIVLVFGTSQTPARFTIGDTGISVPMVERFPGHYYGEYLPEPEDIISSAPVEVTLTDKFGRSTVKRINLPAVSKRE